MPCHERLIPKAFHGRHWRSRELVQRSHHVCRACGWQLPLELVKVGSSSIQGHRNHLGSDLHCLPVPWTHGRHFENGIRVSTPPLVAGGKLLRSSKEDLLIFRHPSQKGAYRSPLFDPRLVFFKARQSSRFMPSSAPWGWHVPRSRLAPPLAGPPRQEIPRTSQLRPVAPTAKWKQSPRSFVPATSKSPSASTTRPLSPSLSSRAPMRPPTRPARPEV